MQDVSKKKTGLNFFLNIIPFFKQKDVKIFSKHKSANLGFI